MNDKAPYARPNRRDVLDDRVHAGSAKSLGLPCEWSLVYPYGVPIRITGAGSLTYSVVDYHSERLNNHDVSHFARNKATGRERVNSASI